MSSQVRGKTAFRFILPAFICMLLVHIIPILLGMYLAFIDLDIYTVTQWIRAPFIGFKNFIDVFSPKTDVGVRYLRSIWNVVYFGLVTIPVGYVIGLLVALLLNRRFFGRTLVRGLILLPYITPDSVAYNVWRFIFQARIGIVNKYLLELGLIDEPILWLVGDRAIYAVMVASIWKGWPFACLILLAGLQSIPQELYEAARIDGASPFALFRFVTFPMLRSVSSTLLLLSAIWNFHAFNQFYILLGTDPGKAHVPSTFILQEAFTNLHLSKGAAMSLFLTFVVLLMTVVLLRFRRREEI